MVLVDETTMQDLKPGSLLVKYVSSKYDSPASECYYTVLETESAPSTKLPEIRIIAFCIIEKDTGEMCQFTNTYRSSFRCEAYGFKVLSL